jgi:hypothetical protein
MIYDFNDPMTREIIKAMASLEKFRGLIDSCERTEERVQKVERVVGRLRKIFAHLEKWTKGEPR